MKVDFKGVVYQLNNGLWQYRVFTHGPSTEDLAGLDYGAKYGYGSESMAKNAMEYSVRTVAESHGCTLEGIDFLKTVERPS